MGPVENLSKLPPEVLSSIFEYVPNRWSLSLVCWDFYEIVCEIERNKFTLKIIDIDDDDKYESIMATKRVFDSMKALNVRNPVDHVVQRLQEVFSKFANDIKKIELWSSIVAQEQIVKLLNETSNVEEVLFYDVEYSDDEETSQSLKLDKLRKFNFHLCNIKIPKIVLKLPRSVLKSLSIENCILKQETLKNIFENQRNIRELEFDPYYVNPSSTEHLKLSKLKLMCNRHVLALLKNQTDLQSLDLSKAHIGDIEFLEVCKLQKLESLKLWIDRISWEILDNLMSLRNMTELSLDYDRLEVEYVRKISRIAMPKLQKLKIKFPRLKILAESFLEMSLNVPHLTNLHISNQSIGVMGALIEHFTNLETLIIGCDSDSPEVVDFPVEKLHHGKLKELCIYSSYADQKSLKCSMSLLKIINDSLINLERLKLHNVVTLNACQLSELLKSHKNLTHIIVASSEEETKFNESFVDALMENGKQLKYFQSHGAEILVHKKILERKFCKIFSSIKIRPLNRQIILRNCKWQHAVD